MLSVTFPKIILLLLTFHAAAIYTTHCCTNRLPLDVFLTVTAAQAAACWSNDLIRFALITVLLVTIYSSNGERRRPGAGSDWERVCQFVKLSRAMLYCASEESWCRQALRMNQFISKSTSEDINTNLLAAISTQESNSLPHWMSYPWIRSKEKGEHVWTAPVSQTAPSQTSMSSVFLKQVPLLECCRFAARPVVCNVGWGQII